MSSAKTVLIFPFSVFSCRSLKTKQSAINNKISCVLQSQSIKTHRCCLLPSIKLYMIHNDIVRSDWGLYFFISVHSSSGSSCTSCLFTWQPSSVLPVSVLDTKAEHLFLRQTSWWADDGTWTHIDTDLKCSLITDNMEYIIIYTTAVTNISVCCLMCHNIKNNKAYTWFYSKPLQMMSSSWIYKAKAEIFKCCLN